MTTRDGDDDESGIGLVSSEITLKGLNDKAFDKVFPQTNFYIIEQKSINTVFLLQSTAFQRHLNN